MKIEHRGYTIDVTATRQMDELWTAKILIWPIVETIIALREHHEVQGYSTRLDAEHAGLQWGRTAQYLTLKTNSPSPHVKETKQPRALVLSCP